MKLQNKNISEKKVKAVSELENFIKTKKTILISSIKGIPASQYQEIVKGLRLKAVVRVPKKSIILRALNSVSDESIEGLKNSIKESSAILFSDIDSFELAAELVDKKTPAKAKAGQEAPEDIEIHPGPTDLVPGPAISELGALGIQIQIEKGKIHIKESKIIVKKGEKISRNAADIMGKLDIKPFLIGFEPVAAFDLKEGKIYLNINIDRGDTLENLKSALGKSLAFSVEIGYFSEDNIKFVIGRAFSSAKAINNLFQLSEETKLEEKKEEGEKNE